MGYCLDTNTIVFCLRGKSAKAMNRLRTTPAADVRVPLQVRAELFVGAAKSAKPIENRQLDDPAPAIAPFDAEQATSHQHAWAKHLGVPAAYRHKHIGFRAMLPISPKSRIVANTAWSIANTLRSLKSPNDRKTDTAYLLPIRTLPCLPLGAFVSLASAPSEHGI